MGALKSPGNGTPKKVKALVLVKEEKGALSVPTPTYQMDLGTSQQVGLL